MFRCRNNPISSFKGTVPRAMVVAFGPVTAVSWLTVVSLLTLNLVEPEAKHRIHGLLSEGGTSSTTVSVLTKEAAAQATVSTQPEATSTSGFLRSASPAPDGRLVVDLAAVLKFLPASLSQCVGWVIVGLVGFATGRLTRRRGPDAVPASVQPRVEAVARSPVKTVQISPPAGVKGVLTPSARKLLARQDGGGRRKDL